MIVIHRKKSSRSERIHSVAPRDEKNRRFVSCFSKEAK